jgi:hypothetical protein
MTEDPSVVTIDAPYLLGALDRRFSDYQSIEEAVTEVRNTQVIAVCVNENAVRRLAATGEAYFSTCGSYYLSSPGILIAVIVDQTIPDAWFRLATLDWELP